MRKFSWVFKWELVFLEVSTYFENQTTIQPVTAKQLIKDATSHISKITKKLKLLFLIHRQITLYL